MKLISSFLVISMFMLPVYARADEPAPDAEYVPVAKGDKVPFDGVVMTEAKILLITKEKIKLKEVTQNYAIDLKLWEFKELQYKKGLDERDVVIARQNEDLNGFWTRNKFELGVVGGFIIGAALTIGIASAVAKTSK